jgi:hypothetical protein
MNEIVDFCEEGTPYISPEQMAKQSWIMWLDHISGKLIAFVAKLLWKIARWLGRITWKFLRRFLRNFLKDLSRMRRKFLEALAEAIGRRIGWFFGILLIIGITMLFTANGFSISKTFSWKGIVTLWETFK